MQLLEFLKKEKMRRERDDLFGGDDDEGFGLGQAVRVVVGNNRGLQNALVLGDRRFNFDGRDPKALYLEDIVRPARKPEKPQIFHSHSRAVSRSTVQPCADNSAHEGTEAGLVGVGKSREHQHESTKESVLVCPRVREGR